jgi:glycosyltransferase involved in cell wall biosynthesis
MKFYNNKNILFVIPDLTGGGAERVIVNIINNLDQKKYAITLALFNIEGELLKELNPKIKIVNLHKKSKLSFFKLLLNLRKLIKSINNVTVVSLLHYTNILSVLSCLYLKPRPRVIICEHSNHRKYLKNSKMKHLRRLLMRYTYKKADKIVAISNEMRDNLILDFNLLATNVLTIYNPIPINEIKKLAVDKQILKSMKISNKTTIIAVGRLTNVKRFDRLIRSFAYVRKYLNVRLLILGQGELLNELKYLSKKLNIEQDVLFLGFQKNPFAWLSMADLFVLSSDYEGFPMVILESMTCGTPVISTDCPTGPREIITNGENGILVPIDNEKELADSILMLLKDKKLRKKFSKNGELRANDFKVEKILPQYESLF